MNKNKKKDREIWCDNCECYVKVSDLREWSGDDMKHLLCPDCDEDLIEPEIQE
jgi:hypothetical protein